MKRLIILALMWALSCVAQVSQSESEGQLELEYIAHSAFRITSPGGSRILIDPFQSRWWIGYDFPSELAAGDAVLLSHPHPDHDAGYAQGKSVPWSVDTRVVNAPGVYKVGDISIRGIRGRHAEPHGKEFAYANTIWLIETAGLRIAHIGDNEPLKEAVAKKMGQVDLFMLPIDDEEHILSFEAVAHYRERLGPLVVVPMHYRHPDLETVPYRPYDLGPIDGWFANQDDGRKLGTHKVSISRTKLVEHSGVWLFEHSPLVTPPE